MKKTVYLNLNLDNPTDLEMYTLLESLGRNKKSIIQIALQRDGWLSGNIQNPKRTVPNSVPKGKPQTKRQTQIQSEQIIHQTEVPAVPKREEQPVSTFLNEPEQPAQTFVSDIPHEELKREEPRYQEPVQQTEIHSHLETNFSGSIAKRFFSDEQLAVISEVIPEQQRDKLTDEEFCRLVKEELQDDTDKLSVKNAFQEALWG